MPYRTAQRAARRDLTVIRTVRGGLMAGRLEGKVALITGAARGQGRSHALALAREGADIFGVDMCAQVASVAYPLSTTDDLAQTTRLVTGTGRRIETYIGDVRS